MKNSKIYFLLFATLLLSSGAFAQLNSSDNTNTTSPIQKGKFLLTGDFSVYSNVQENSGGATNPTYTDNNFGISIAPKYALSNRIALGLGLGYNSAKQKFEYETNSNTNTTSIFSVIPSLSVYGNLHFGWLQPKLEVGIPIGFGTSKRNSTDTSAGTDSDNKSKIGQFGGFVAGGANFYLSNTLAISTSIGFLSYTNEKRTDDDSGAESSTNTLNLNFKPNSISLGLVFLLH